MKVRVTLMTENDEHAEEEYSDEEIQKTADELWNYIAKFLNGECVRDRCTVEKVEVVER